LSFYLEELIFQNENLDLGLDALRSTLDLFFHKTCLLTEFIYHLCHFDCLISINSRVLLLSTRCLLMLMRHEHFKYLKKNWRNFEKQLRPTMVNGYTCWINNVFLIAWFCLSGLDTVQARQASGTGCGIRSWNTLFVWSSTFNSCGAVVCARKYRRSTKHISCGFDVGQWRWIASA